MIFEYHADIDAVKKALEKKVEYCESPEKIAFHSRLKQHDRFLGKIGADKAWIMRTWPSISTLPQQYFSCTIQHANGMVRINGRFRYTTAERLLALIPSAIMFAFIGKSMGWQRLPLAALITALFFLSQYALFFVSNLRQRREVVRLFRDLMKNEVPRETGEQDGL